MIIITQANEKHGAMSLMLRVVALCVFLRYSRGPPENASLGLRTCLRLDQSSPTDVTPYFSGNTSSSS